MPTLYWKQSTGAFAPDLIMRLAGVPCRRVRVDSAKGEHQTAEYLSINPMGRIPALVLDDGTIMTESAAMVAFLVDAYPEARLAPPPGTAARARFLRWLVFLAVEAYGADLRLYYPDRYTTDPAGAESVKAAAARDFDRVMGVVETALESHTFLTGEDWTAVDLYMMMIANWDDLSAHRPRIMAACARMREHPVVEAAWQEYFAE
jgi:glutathione S-transferase